MAAAVTNINVLPLFSRAEQLPFKIPVHVPAHYTHMRARVHTLHTHIVVRTIHR